MVKLNARFKELLMQIKVSSVSSSCPSMDGQSDKKVSRELLKQILVDLVRVRKFRRSEDEEKEFLSNFRDILVEIVKL